MSKYVVFVAVMSKLVLDKLGITRTLPQNMHPFMHRFICQFHLEG